MVAASAFSYVSPEDYLAAEATSPTKHEYRDGEVYAMAGGTDAHVTIALNFWALLRGHLRDQGCRAYALDMKARIEVLNCYYYPDVMVTCDDHDLPSSTFKGYPCLIVEVLSDSTEALDRGDKFTDYRHLESLQEYVLVSQTRQQVEVFRRNTEGLWVLHPFSEGDRISLASVGWEGAIADLYEDVTFSESDAAPLRDAEAR
ncbi:Uma2 family endonuclease [Nodosilinea sp. LEGE 06152]|uniref:Uma2 family endonuclease n=1 Tax=Nodosilinea sp. LEGE 06152 TaxID=2777966 RepID=UPI00188003BA|nr:Uma2 family endonuclease [Nodosilinea sp. LEGE 06152]MBE9157937.1 Uma2 family endonuclease [Nodosilinea sp. LEGE 06152]